MTQLQKVKLEKEIRKKRKGKSIKEEEKIKKLKIKLINRNKINKVKKQTNILQLSFYT